MTTFPNNKTPSRLCKIYLETSFINIFSREFQLHSAHTVKTHGIANDKVYLISPVNIFEILQIKNNSKRELLLYFCQNLFHEICLPSPEELILRHLNLDTPAYEKDPALHTENHLAAIWKEIAIDSRKTFKFDMDDFVRRKTVLSLFFKSMRSFIRENQSPKICFSDQDGKHREDSLEDVLQNHNIRLFDMDLNQAFIYIFIIAILCFEIGIDPEPIKQFWGTKGIRTINDRLAYLLHTHPNCFNLGPAASMGLMARLQAEKSPNAGAIFDCFHIVYLPYVDYFFVNDAGFVGFRNGLPPWHARKVVHYSETTFQTR